LLWSDEVKRDAVTDLSREAALECAFKAWLSRVIREDLNSDLRIALWGSQADVVVTAWGRERQAEDGAQCA
jgi:hypothetical protein